jgi:hypothetical protein
MTQEQQSEPGISPDTLTPDKSAIPELRSQIWQLWEKLVAYAYMLGWCLSYSFRLHVAPYLAYVVGIFSLFEVGETLLHLAVGHRLGERGTVAVWLSSHMTGLLNERGRTMFWLSLISIPVTLSMVYHHHRMLRRVERHNILLSSLRDVAVEAMRLATSSHAIAAEAELLRRILQALTFSLERANPKTPKLDATVVWRHETTDNFRLFLQYPDNTYNFPPEGLPLGSAADEALKAESKGVVYVPFTSVRHGVLLTAVETVTPRYSRMSLLSNVFKPLEAGYVPLCHACVQIPTNPNEQSRYVLSLDADKRSCMGQLEFHALQVVASFVGMLLASPKRDLTPTQDGAS